MILEGDKKRWMRGDVFVPFLPKDALSFADQTNTKLTRTGAQSYVAVTTYLKISD